MLWYLPLLLLLVFRPNLADRRPDPIQAERDWVRRWRRAINLGIGRLIHLLLPHKEEPARH